MVSQVKIVDLPGSEKKDDSEQAKPKSKSSPRPTQTADRELRSRIAGCFERIAAAAEVRGDEELAEIIREDMEVMAQGVVFLTRPFKAARAPIVLILGIVEPVMAFSRVTRVLVGRFFERRAHRNSENTDNREGLEWQ